MKTKPEWSDNKPRMTIDEGQKPFRTKGTEEWADKNINITRGCEYDCPYCYAKRNALRFGRIDGY